LAKARLAAIAAIVVLAGCGGAPKPPPPTAVSGSIEAAATLNPSVSRRPSPLLLRVYELKSAAQFGSADFMSLYRSDQTAIGTEFVAREEFTLQPGQTVPYNKTLAPETRFIGVVGAYRDLERANWRAVAAVQPNKPQKVKISAGELAVSVTVQP
jgi:type VI secretion system protein VasD